MTLTDQRYISLTSDGRTASGIGDLRARVAALERGGGTGGSGGVGAVHTGDALTGDVSGNLLGPILVDSLTNLTTAAITDPVASDIVHGENREYFTTGGLSPKGQRWNIQHGGGLSGDTYTTPVSVDGPTFKVSRTEAFTSITTGGAYVENYSSIYGINIGLASTKAQPVGVVGKALSYSNQAKVVDSSNPDAVGVQGIGVVSTGNVNGRGIGGDFEGFAVAGKLTGVEARSRNATGVDSAFNPTGGSDMMNLWLSTGGGNKVGAAISMGKFTSADGYDVGIGIPYVSALGTSIVTSSFRDDCRSAISLDIRGIHATAAIAVAAGAGKVLVGTSSSGQPTAALIRPSVDSDSGLRIQRSSSTVIGTADLMRIQDETATHFFRVDAQGRLAFRWGSSSLPSTINIGWVDATTPSTVAANGINFGGDTSLFRNAAGGLCVSAATANTVFRLENTVAGNIVQLSFRDGATTLWKLTKTGPNDLNITDVANSRDLFTFTPTAGYAIKSNAIPVTAAPGTPLIYLDMTVPSRDGRGGVGATGDNRDSVRIRLGDTTSWGTTTNGNRGDTINATGALSGGHSAFQDVRSVLNNFNAKGGFYAFESWIKETNPGAASPNNYHEVGNIVAMLGVPGATTQGLANKGGYYNNLETLGVILADGDTPANGALHDAGPARFTSIYAQVQERNTYASYNDTTIFPSGSYWLNSGAAGYSLFSTGSQVLGTGIFLTGAAGYKRGIVLNDGTNDLWCLDGLGNVGFGVTVNQANATLPAKISLASATTAAGGMDFGGVGQLYMSATTAPGTLTTTMNLAANGMSLSATDGSGFLRLKEQTSAPAAPGADIVRIYAEDDGAGKTRVMAKFNSGAAQQIAIQP